nr:sigma-54-dependent Fis family transcriptional regulator [candidate division Zixibacteria bacterium]
MIRNVFILADKEVFEKHPDFRVIFESLGEFVGELSHLYTLLKERTADLILIAEQFPGINAGIIRKIRRRSPMADIWKVVSHPAGIHPDHEDPELFEGIINCTDGRERIAPKVGKILNQKSLLDKYGIIGRSEKMKVVAETIDRIAPTDITVLINGPSGSGKELVARAIHDNSPRAGGRYVAINCGALAEGVLESELFGHEKGAFTGSVSKREGLFVQANGGTIFLDEIGETKPDMQVKLLRVLEDGYFHPVGGDRPIRSDARVIAATNRDLFEAIREGRFREDLYFRLGVVKINLAPLFERRGDILPLLCHFASGEKIGGFSDSALEVLERYDWPGNVRQLKNFVARMGALYPGEQISLTRVEQFLAEQSVEQRNLPVVTGHTPEEAGHELIYHALLSLGSEVKRLRDLILDNIPAKSEVETEPEYIKPGKVYSGRTLKEMEQEMIEKALHEADGNRKLAARKLGIGERTLYRKIKEYGLN